MIERPIHLSEIEKILLFKKWCKDHEVERIIFDGDDTLWGTSCIFDQYIDECSLYLAGVSGTPADEWAIRIRKVNNKLYESHSVNPNKWNLVMDEVALQTDMPTLHYEQSLDILAKIYQTPPQFLPEAEESLEFLRKTGFPMGVVTHANEEWTRFKNQVLRLVRFFDWDDICIIDENGHKTKETWGKAFKFFGVKPENCLVVGDSPRSDIIPAFENGVRQLFLVQSGPVWSTQDRPVDPIVRRISSLKELTNLGQEVLTRTAKTI